MDMNNNGIPDGCECPTGDSDRDGVCDGQDLCPGLDDFSDACQNGLAVNNCNNFIAAPSITGVLDETLIVSWLGDGTAVDLQYREVGESTWQNSSSSDGYAVLSLLRRCTDYQIRIKGACNGTDIYSSITNATTSGCVDCSTTDLEMFVFNVEGTSAILAWDVMPGTMYRLHYREVGAASYQTYTTPIPFVVLLGLDDCTSYEFALSVYCQDGVQSGLSTPISFTTSDCKGAGNASITLNDGHSISIYPSPAIDQVLISLTNEVEADVIKIYNAAGQIMIDQNEINFDGVAYKTNVSHLTEGMYFVMTVIGDTVETKQFIVK